MDPLTAGQWAALISVLAGSGGGIWFVARQVIRNQSDFIDRYAADIKEMKAEQAAAEARTEAKVSRLEQALLETQRRELACQAERAALRVAVRTAGVAWPDPTEWDTG